MERIGIRKIGPLRMAYVSVAKADWPEVKRLLNQPVVEMFVNETAHYHEVTCTIFFIRRATDDDIAEFFRYVGSLNEQVPV